MQQQDQHSNIDVHLQVQVLDHSANSHLVDVLLEGLPVKDIIIFMSFRTRQYPEFEYKLSHAFKFFASGNSEMEVLCIHSTLKLSLQAHALPHQAEVQ